MDSPTKLQQHDVDEVDQPNQQQSRSTEDHTQTTAEQKSIDVVRYVLQLYVYSLLIILNERRSCMDNKIPCILLLFTDPRKYITPSTNSEEEQPLLLSASIF